MDDDVMARTEPDDGMPDVTALPLRRLLREGDSVLDNALRRLVAAEDHRPRGALGDAVHGEMYAAFESAI
jgi:hypothetical protein